MKKIFKKALLSVWAMSILMHIFAPLTLVLALENPFDVTFTVEDIEKFKIEKNYDEIKITDLSNNQFRLIKIYSGDEKVATDLVLVTCSSSSVCKFSVDGSVTNYRIDFDTTFNDITEGENAIYTNTNLTGARDFVIKEHINTPSGGDNNNNNNQEPVSTEDYTVTVMLDKNMKKYYEMTDGTNVINLSLKNTSEPAKSISLYRNDDNTKAVITTTVTCNDNKDSCTMIAPANTIVNLNYDTKVISLASGKTDEQGNLITKDGYPEKDEYRDEDAIRNNKYIVIDEPRDFDGKAVLLWDCDGKICYNYSNFDDLSSQVAKTTYMDETTITNQNTNAGATTIKFSVHSREKFFAPYWKFQVLKDEIDAGTKKLDAYKGESGIDYPPLEEPSENNTYISYMNRGPKMIIYNEDFRGIKLADLESLNYYPSEWANAFNRRESYDISGTTKDNPTEILALLLQDNVTINALSTYNGFTIKSIEALDVPEGAVEVAKVDNKFNLIFHSNYFEKVVFKALDNEDHEYYFLVNRRTMDPGFNRIGHGEDAILEAEIFYDNHKTYEDYNVLGKIQYKNGSTKVIDLTITNYGDDGFGNAVDALEWDEDDPPFGDAIGKGIKRAKFTYTISDAELKTVDKIYINVEKAGSTGTTYAGNFAGSGKGNVIDMADWKLQLYGEDRV